MAAATDALERALSIARAQEARWLELRAATDLARLHAQQGRRTDATALLASALGGYPDALDLPDLRAARELRAAL